MAETELTEHEAAAVDAGLIYVSDAKPGIRRRRAGRGFTYLDPGGKTIRDPELLKRIRGLVIPPDWTEVWICPERRGHIQVTARDARGRKQYRYHPKYRAVRDETKFERIFEFSELLPELRKKVERDLSKEGHGRERVLALVVRLLEKTLIRIGNDEYARQNRSYGLTTLRQRHVEVEGNEMRFEFRGKSGVKHEVTLTDKRLARIVQHCQTLPGEELFQYIDDDGKRRTVDSGDINEYLGSIAEGKEITAKDFRTWAGTMLAAKELRALEAAGSQREAKSNIVKAVDKVAGRLGNTRAVCRKYYIHPTILEAYMNGETVPAPTPVDPARHVESSGPTLRQDEAIVLEFLRAHQRT
jgi:DNA topoisomerase-1